MESLTHRLPRIDEVPSLSEEDRVCFAEVRDVLAKHGRLQRFGICLLHEHFALAEDEILTEAWDAETRTLVSRPRRRAEESSKRLIETSWRLDTGMAIGDCQETPTGGHYSDS